MFKQQFIRRSLTLVMWMDYACPVWRSTAQCHIRKLQVFQCKCLRIATDAPWYISNRQIHEDLGVPFFADHIRALTESFDSKLADAGNPLVWQLGRYLTEGWPKSPEAQAKGDDGQQTGRGRPWNGHQVDQTNRAQQSSFRRFSATPTEVLPWFSSVVRRMPRRGTARIPPQAQRPHRSACIQSRI
jgi:hypothetical protein